MKYTIFGESHGPAIGVTLTLSLIHISAPTRH